MLGIGAFVLRLHYLLRPQRKRVMPGLYMIGALGLAQIGAILVVVWAVAYPFIAWAHTWNFIGLDTFITKCARATAVPDSCSFAAEFGYLVDAIITTNFFALLALASHSTWSCFPDTQVQSDMHWDAQQMHRGREGGKMHNSVVRVCTVDPGADLETSPLVYSMTALLIEVLDLNY